MIDFLSEHLFYIPFIIFNIWVIYKVIKIFVYDEEDEDDTNNDEDDDGGITIDDPDIDLPPGVSLPSKPKDLVLE